MSQYLWTLKYPDGTDFCDGIRFRSRHGDDLLLWAIYERDTDNELSSRITDIQVTDLDLGSPELRKVMALLGLIGLGERL
ncbi:hypothetical protein [Arthrobacter sulfonylureivorans]|uniref:Uncharacterized protein n=1 Tax=Arthrobacter sulfonylureivorans TaxID=2486855 RepID=A0ABY3WHQ5_9MICC|nr:hypothetical protein [Arthrobacter sulfonylureivorans]UNK47837.1 hypothetical protein MNQ99_18345 [Arthrobacter sulfonylureivorans]